ncbi:MAG: 5-(carboxyamino)imidazole ribonucleotide synthase [Paracoccaceae bacterium]|nr:5-(carboxyamino)imidazole ribonucleotide synthase [Paracoccaceae bacterium]
MTEPLAPGAVIGILGGGQLGRMLSVAASRLGFRCHIYDPAEGPPAADVAWKSTTGAWEDAAALAAFARGVDVVTYEFENVPADSLDAIEAEAPVFPPRAALATSQDRLTEKNFLTRLGLATAAYAAAASVADIDLALGTIAGPAILKTRRLGYDGKGQATLSGPADAAAAFERIGGEEAIVEGRVFFARELSVIAARGRDGRVIAFEPGENVHRDGILRTTTVPSAAPRTTRAEAVEIATAILEALDYVGVIGVELFETGDGLLVNEFAPRVHNSGHWTMDGGTPCQFEAHIRAIAGWPLPQPVRTADVVMENLVGEEAERAVGLATEPGAALHLYGKADMRPGRKMGHLNRVTPV